MIKRQLIEHIEDTCFTHHKMAFISGPRQVGKTTLSKQLASQFAQSKYITWDDPRIRKQWNENPLFFTEDFNLKSKSLLIVDEIHKSKLWKTQLKGLWDQKKQNLNLIVTGSAQLNTLRKAGDSLLGRYYHFNLHPLTVGEILQTSLDPDAFIKAIYNNDYPEKIKKFERIYTGLKEYSGFPEPYLAQDPRQLNLWRKTRLDRLIREDLRDISRIPDLSSIEILASLLPEKVGSGLSVENLRMDLETSHNTVKRWLKYLEAVYFHYSIRPYAKNISNSLRKEPKIYLYDYSEIENIGAKFENMIANHLYKTCHLWTDIGHGLFELHYIRTKQHIEIDFLITKNKKPWLAIESKKSNQNTSTPTLNLLGKLNCPLVLLTEQELKPKLITTAGPNIISKVSIGNFLPMLA